MRANEALPKGRDIFDTRAFAHVATIGAGGGLQGRVKDRNLQRSGKVALAVQDPDNPYRYVQVRGRAELIDEGAEGHIDRYPWRRPGEVRVTVRVVPEHVQGMG